jgi:hypothetical protein
VLVLDYLLEVRRDMLAGRLNMHVGEPNIDRMWGLVVGYHACLGNNGFKDEEYDQFRSWLREKGEYPSRGWASKYLRDCNGDHALAIRKYLDFVQEFVSQHRR